MRFGVAIGGFLTGAVLGIGSPAAVATAAPCTRDDFAAVVDQAGDALRAMNAENTPRFQAKLRALKQQHKWSQEQFMAEAAPFVQDDSIQTFDEQTGTLLNKIQGLGGGGGGRQPDCGLLDVLRAHMQSLVETTQAKWAYMNGKLDKALAPN